MFLFFLNIFICFYVQNTLSHDEIKIFNQQRHSIQFQQYVKQLSQHIGTKTDILSSDVSKNIKNKESVKIIKNAVKIHNVILEHNEKRKKLKVYHFDNGHYMCSPTGMLQLINILYKNGEEADKKLKTFLKHIEKCETPHGTPQHYVTMADMLTSWYNNLSDSEKQKIPQDAYKHFTGIHERCDYLTDLTLLMKIFPDLIKKDFSYLPKKSNNTKLALTIKLTKNNILYLDKAIDKDGISKLPKQFNEADKFVRNTFIFCILMLSLLLVNCILVTVVIAVKFRYTKHAAGLY